MPATAVYFEIQSYKGTDRSEKFIVVRTTYYVSDGHKLASQFAGDPCDTRAEAESLLAHHRIHHEFAAAREP